MAIAIKSSVEGTLKRRAWSSTSLLPARMTNLVRIRRYCLKGSFENVNVGVVLMKHSLQFSDDMWMRARNVTATLSYFSLFVSNEVDLKEFMLPN
jgi:hypothetical protein